MGHPLSCCSKLLDIQNDCSPSKSSQTQVMINPDILTREDVICISKLGSLLHFTKKLKRKAKNFLIDAKAKQKLDLTCQDAQSPEAKLKTKYLVLSEQ
jgi:hypothetical protein